MRLSIVWSLVLLAAATGWAEETHEELVDRALRLAQEKWEDRQKELMVNGSQSSRPKPKYPREAQDQDREFWIYKEALEVLQSLGNVSHEHAHRSLRQTSGVCAQPRMACANSPYRTQDGSCNNLNNPYYGMGSSNIMQNRLMPPAYDDGVNVPRGGNPSRLASARYISKTCHPDRNILFPGITNMVHQFGQFIDHDMSITPEAGAQCCTTSRDPNCWPIQITQDDQFYRSQNPPQSCMDFTRSTACSNPQNGAREQTNMNTAYLDCSQVYGSTTQRTNQLRSFQGGRLITNAQLGPFLPFARQSNINNQQVQGAFIAGDDRINEMPGLAVMHNVWFMEHNRIADQFRSRGWSDQKIFDETRRIVIAEMQQVIYNEYLPVILGQATCDAYGITLPPPGSYSSYDPSVNPTMLNEFTTVAYRFGHSMVNNVVQLYDVNGNNIGSYNIRDNFNEADQITQANGQGYDWILKGLCVTNSQNFDSFGATGLTQFLFVPRGGAFGGDLFARNIQRGRDHGIPSYNQIRQACGKSAITLGSSPPDMDASQFSQLSRCYNNANDVDFFTAMLLERPANGGVTGFTSQCVMAVQFDRLKRGDRYFFTHSQSPYPFTPAQLQKIRTITYSDIICRNSQQTSLQSNVFLMPGGSNINKACNHPDRQFNVLQYF